MSMQLQRAAEMAKLNEDIRLARIAVDTASGSSPTPVQLDYLGHLLGNRYALKGAMQDLAESITLGRRAVDTSLGHPDRLRFMNNLVASLSDRFQRLRQRSDLDEAIGMAEAVVQATTRSDPNRSAFLQNLGGQYSQRFALAGITSDLDKAIQYLRQAVDAAAGDRGRRDIASNNLVITLGQRYERFGGVVDLEEAIRIAQIVVSETPTNHPERARRLNSLANRMGERYSMTKALADLDEAIQVAEQALAAIPPRHHDRAAYLNNLAILLGDKYLRSDNSKGLDRAIQVAEEALEATPKDHPGRPAKLNNLAIRLRDKYRTTKMKTDNERTINLLQEAIDMTGEGNPDQCRWLYNLSLPLIYRYRYTDNPADLDRVIDTIQKALIALPDGHIDQAAYLNTFGDRLGDRYKKTGDKADLEKIVASHQSALHQVNSSFLDRILGGKKVLQYHAKTSDWQRAYEDATFAVNLIPRLTTRSLGLADKQHLLGLIVGLACDAAAVALNAGKKPEDALDILEQGRGILATSLDEMRTDILDLKDKHPELAKEYVRIQDILAGPIAQGMLAADNDGGSYADKRITAGHDFERLIVKIRAQSGFESFLLPPGEEHMRAAAKNGPIVVVNVSGLRCDAIIIEQDKIRSLRLADLNKGIDLIAQKRKLGSQKSLAWLWEVITKPVLDALCFTRSPADGKWPHIWWIPTARLSRFPLHAAGYHTKNSSDTVLDRVMSSYSSSVKAIIRGRRHQAQSEGSGEPDRALLVEMANTPDIGSLDFAAEEVEMVQGLCKLASLEVVKSTGLKSDVVSHLPNCKIFHFAGHGSFNPTDPSQSALLLSDWKDDPLTVANLLEMDLRDRSPFCAYLSACGTGLTFDKKFMDESINIVGACQLAGFRHVVGTLWKVKDDNCLYMAETTYKEMISGGMTNEAVCLGLHIATRGLREKWLQDQKSSSHARIRAQTEEARDSDENYEHREDGGGNVSRSAKGVSDNNSLPWVAYVHFGV